jgi:rare lipoprotein A (peptidoglycan hydrolase)
MKSRSFVLCSLFLLFVSCYPNTRWWDEEELLDPEEGNPASVETSSPRAGITEAKSEPPALHDVETGIASYMADEINGRMTANGELYDMRHLTAAHPSLPFGTLVEVKNLANGKTVQLRINDRGPYVPGRIIDLSFQAARDLELTEQGSGKVEIRIIQLPR